MAIKLTPCQWTDCLYEFRAKTSTWSKGTKTAVSGRKNEEEMYVYYDACFSSEIEQCWKYDLIQNIDCLNLARLWSIYFFAFLTGIKYLLFFRSHYIYNLISLTALFVPTRLQHNNNIAIQTSQEIKLAHKINPLKCILHNDH